MATFRNNNNAKKFPNIQQGVDVSQVANRGPNNTPPRGVLQPLSSGGDLLIDPDQQFRDTQDVANFLNNISQGTAGTFGTNVPFQFNPDQFNSPLFGELSSQAQTQAGGAASAVGDARQSRQALIEDLIAGTGASQAFQQQGFDDSLAANLALARGAGGTISAGNQRALSQNVAQDQSRIRNEASQIRQQELGQALSGLLGGQQLEQGLLSSQQAVAQGATQQDLANQQRLQELLAQELLRSRTLQEQRAGRRQGRATQLLTSAIKGGAETGAVAAGAV